MVNKISFDDQLTFWWDRIEKSTDERFVITCGEFSLTAITTHATFKNLQADTEYFVQVGIVNIKSGAKKILDSFTVKTLPSKKIIDVTKPPYNAKGDGKTVNTAALQKAIDDCDQFSKVYVPKGVFMTGALNLHSNMELFIDVGGEIKGVDSVEDYLPKRKSRFEGIELMCYSSVINMGELDNQAGYNCENVILRGGGTISCLGKTLRKNTINTEMALLKKEMKDFYSNPNGFETINTIPGRRRSRLVNVSNSQNVVMADLTFKDGASWNVHMIYSDNITTFACEFYSADIVNGDGWDPDSSTNCTLFDCAFHTGDDCIAIKSGKNPEGNIINRPTKCVKIFDVSCTMGHGLAIGSEMSGGVEDVHIWDCDFQNSKHGLIIKSRHERGGYVHNVNVHDSTFSEIFLGFCSVNWDGEPAKTMPKFNGFTFDNIKITREKGFVTNDPAVAPAIIVCGFGEDEPIRNVIIKNLTITNWNDDFRIFKIKYVKGFSIENLVSI